MRQSSISNKLFFVRCFFFLLLGPTLFIGCGGGQASRATLPFFHSPQIVAHRAGSADAPENTLYAIQLALNHGADILWLSVQVTKEGVPILYRPPHLEMLTDGQGKVDQTSLWAIRKLNAGYRFKKKLPHGKTVFPFRNQPVAIPTLEEALQKIPPHIPLFLDMKSPCVARLVHAVARVLEKSQAWNRVRIYSTQSEHLQMWKIYPKARLFEERAITRQRLVDLLLGNRHCIPPLPGTWVGIEWERPVEVVESFTLGQGVSKSVAHWWTPIAMKCHRKLGRVYIVLFGIEGKAAYRAAKRLGADAIMTDSPATLLSEKCIRISDPSHTDCLRFLLP